MMDHRLDTGTRFVPVQILPSDLSFLEEKVDVDELSVGCNGF